MDLPKMDLCAYKKIDKYISMTKLHTEEQIIYTTNKVA